MSLPATLKKPPQEQAWTWQTGSIPPEEVNCNLKKRTPTPQTRFFSQQVLGKRRHEIPRDLPEHEHQAISQSRAGSARSGPWQSLRHNALGFAGIVETRLRRLGSASFQTSDFEVSAFQAKCSRQPP